MTELNVENRTIFVSDNLPILKGLNSDAVRVPHKDGAPHTGGFSGAATDITDPSYTKTGKVPETWWEIAIAPRSSKEYVGYPTQKPLALLERIIRASSNEGEVVLDPFCGCATTCVAAERNNRQWIGIDLSPLAFKPVRDRLRRQDEGIALWAKNATRRRAGGGLHILSNLQLLCGWCNRTKGDRTMNHLRDHLRDEALHNA